MNAHTVEPQYKALLELDRQSFGLMSSATWLQDPKRLTFLLSRYKFVSRMLEGQQRVIEIGCADGFGSRIVCQTVDSLTALDFDPIFIADAKKTSDPQWPVDFVQHDMLKGPLPQKYTAAYALDVLEHIAPGGDEACFLTNLCGSLEDSGVAVIGMPSIESQGYASPASKEGHINCQSGAQLQSTLLGHFTNCFMFSMNDEVVHTGFQPMAHYLLALCVGPRR